MYGYAGKVLRVNLTDEKVSKEVLKEEVARNFIGGRGIGAYFLFRELKPKIDPLSEENKVIFSSGPMEGSMLPGASRFLVCAKSPLTKIWGEGTAAGKFGIMMKRAGFDAIIIEGVSKRPVYLWVDDGEVEIRDATHLWGKPIGDVDEAIREEVDDRNISVAAVGPASENGVLYGCIISDKVNAVGRTGMGTVMASKKLKALAIRGHKKLKFANPEKLDDLRRELSKKLLEKILNKEGWVYTLRKYGTAGNLLSLNERGILPTRNFREGVFEGASNINGDVFEREILARRDGCPGCPVACKKVVRIENYEYGSVEDKYGVLEYESVAALGSLIGLGDFRAVAKAVELCNRYGMDTISTGVSVAFAIEVFENGIINEEDTGGLILKWGNAKDVIKLVELIGKREGFGKVLSEGVKRASEIIDKGAEKFAMHVKGLEIPMHDPRGKKGLGLSYATSVRGACHMQVPHDSAIERRTWPEIGITKTLSRFDASNLKAEYISKLEAYVGTMFNSLLLCRFTDSVYDAEVIISALEYITGWKFKPEELLDTGNRILTLARMFNVREGVSRKDDKLPGRFGVAFKRGASKDQRLTGEDIERMLDIYYEVRGWNKNGIPTPETLRKLGLEFAIPYVEV
ncbi:MAG: aldehyde ferredoxin oxidoreductase family protein [Candidatus Asgardarchaeia archaeon]